MKRQSVSLCKFFGLPVLSFLMAISGAWGSVNSAVGKQSDNLLITQQQLEIEQKAMLLMANTDVIGAKSKVVRQWKAVLGKVPGERAWTSFDSMVEEYVFLHLLNAVNGDPNYPRITPTVFAPPHEWLGLKVSGSRAAGPNPDNHYRSIPIDSSANYVLQGQLQNPQIFDFGLSLMSNTFYTRKLPILEKRDIDIGEDGSFTITIGPEPATNNKNHLQTTDDTELLFIRDTRTDWRQRANLLTITRLEPPAAEPMDDKQIVSLAIREMMANVPYAFWWMRITQALEPNSMTTPTNTGEVGGLVTQSTSFGRAELNDDEALVITVTSGGAGYFSLSLYDFWYRSMNTATDMSSLNNAQSIPDSDGRITYVVSARDPGVHNWLQTSGENQLMLIYRWQNLPNASNSPPLTMEAREVKFDQLRAALPEGVAKVDDNERKKQLRQRTAHYENLYQ